MPNLFLSGLFIGFVLILGEIAIKAVLWTILALWLIVGALVALTLVWVYVKRFVTCRKSTT